ncbi:alanine racemase [Bacillus sp. FJAT-29790]|uniref:alanine racemase n=1 Tax=Bacillus sp. FJAT-29790 TaxID=1895002 RepID=UPI001C237813|nr:alanine racemase [Bacillus sp. FJAT-29790]
MDSLAVFYRDTWVEVNLDHISHNIELMKKHLFDVKIFSVIKANAYGHGDVEVAKAALEAGVSYLAVAFLDEALALRNKGITAPILILGACRPEDAGIAAKHKITVTVFQKEWLQKAKGYIEAGDKLTMHLKFETGMGRLGIRSKETLMDLEKIAEDDPHLYIEGVFTHFATADELDSTYFNQQMDRFQEMLSWLKKTPKWIHSSNSAAALRFPEAHLNAVRMGISMYGLTPSMEMEPILPFPLKPALSLHTKLVHVKKVQKGDKLSYGATYEAMEDEWIGTLPIGYADGWIRKLQGQEVLVEGKRVPIVGRICMDQCMIKLPSEMPVGTPVTLIGQQGNEEITANEIAKKLDTINYEITCMITGRVPRVYKKNGEVIRIINALF